MTLKLAPAVLLALALAGCGTAASQAPRPAVTVTHTVTAKPTVKPSAKAHKHHHPAMVAAPVATPIATCEDACGATEPVIFDAGSYSGTEPNSIDLSGDGGNVPYDLSWQNWPAGPNGIPPAGATATANGTVNLQGCVPNCATGTDTPTPVTIVLSNAIPGDPTLWGAMTEYIQGQSPSQSFTYPSFWALGAK